MTDSIQKEIEQQLKKLNTAEQQVAELRAETNALDDVIDRADRKASGPGRLRDRLDEKQQRINAERAGLEALADEVAETDVSLDRAEDLNPRGYW